MKVYEYSFSVHVQAEDEMDAWLQVVAISEALDGIDCEGESTTEGPEDVTYLYEGRTV